MSFKLIWDAVGEHIYENGVERGVLYLQDASGSYPKGEAWNGLTAVTQSPSGAEANPIFADNIKYLNLYSAEDFGATVEAYSYPESFEACQGRKELVSGSGVYISMQERQAFGLCYRTIIGNDTKGDSFGYKLHFIYGAKASPTEVAYSTLNDSPEPVTMSWEISTVPVEVTGFKPTAYLEIDSTKCDAAKLANLEAILYGTAADGSTAAVEARLPLPNEIMTILA